MIFRGVVSGYGLSHQAEGLRGQNQDCLEAGVETSQFIFELRLYNMDRALKSSVEITDGWPPSSTVKTGGYSIVLAYMNEYRSSE